jgi:hypothetical protein
MRTMEDLLGEDNYWRVHNSGEGMIEGMVVWIMSGLREEMIPTEEMIQEERKERKRKKRKEKEKEEEQKRKEKNVELRRDTASAEAMAIADRQAMEEHYYEDYEDYYEEEYEYDQEQRAYY